MKIFRIGALAALFMSVMLISALSQKGSNESHKAILAGFNEVPAVSSTGSGELRLKINDDAETIEFELTYENLEGTTTGAAHIHIGQEGANGGVVAFFCGGATTPPCTPGSGSFSGVIRPADITAVAAQGIAAGEWDEVVRAMRAGRIYANVHTNKHPAGEIRGQVK